MRLSCFFIVLASVEAFVVTRTQRPPTIALRSENSGGVARVFGLVAAVSVFSLSSPPAIASELQLPVTPFASSTVQVADAIKVLDMGLPSYGDIKESKASVENVKSLSTEATGMMSKSKKSSTESDSRRGSETKSASQKQANTPKKEVYVPKREEATPLPKYDF